MYPGRAAPKTIDSSVEAAANLYMLSLWFGVYLAYYGSMLDRSKIELYNRPSDVSTMNEQIPTFQSAIAIVESLPVEQQTMLVRIINNRLKEQRRSELIAEVKIAEQEYAQGNVKRGSVADFMTELRFILEKLRMFMRGLFHIFQKKNFGMKPLYSLAKTRI